MKHINDMKPCCWMEPDATVASNALIVYRSRFNVDCESVLPLVFSADERAQIFLDGERVAEGPERGCPERWYQVRLMLHAPKGKHVLTARVMQFDEKLRAYAQMSVHHGFFFDSPSGVFREWQWKESPGLEFSEPFPDWGTFPRVHVGHTYEDRILRGEGDGWKQVALFEDHRLLHEPDLPPMDYTPIQADSFDGTTYYFKDYTLFYPLCRFTGHGHIRLRCFETPYQSGLFDSLLLKGDKGNRNGSHFIGNADEFEVHGELTWLPFWWRSGHYMRVETTGDVRCEVEFLRTGYPYTFPSTTVRVMRAAFETLRNCSFETYMDCPHYEQLLYVGDARLEALSTYCFSDDHRLAAKCLRLLLLSQSADGAIRSQYPSKGRQVIPSFMTSWILMYSDWIEVHGMDSLAKELFPGALKLMNYLYSQVASDGLIRMRGWNFIDWCANWENGVPPCPEDEPNSMLNLFAVLAFRAFARLPVPYGDSMRWNERADLLLECISTVYYVPERKLLAIDSARCHFSEHSQVLGILAGSSLPLAEGLERERTLTACGIYFSYYYLDACRKAGLNDLFRLRMRQYEKLPSERLTTLPEEFENPRSDCHAWSSHILCFQEQLMESEHTQ